AQGASKQLPPLSPADEQRLRQLTAYVSEAVGEPAAAKSGGAAGVAASARAERAAQLASQLSRAGHSGRLRALADDALAGARRRACASLVGALSGDFLRAVVAACQRHRQSVSSLESALKLRLADSANAGMREEVLGFRPVADALDQLLAELVSAEPRTSSDAAPGANRLRALCDALASVGAFDSLVWSRHLRPRLAAEFAVLAESLLAGAADAAAYLTAVRDAAERVAGRAARRYRPEVASATKALAAEALVRGHWATCVQLLAADLQEASGVDPLARLCRSLPAEFGATQLLAEAALAAGVALPDSGGLA
ncbi:hypothetical protein BOX15_Mlig028526g2, partial [Macrostomum lignano]